MQEESPCKVERPDHRLWSVDVWLVAMWPLARLEHASCGLRSGQWACVGSFKMPHDVCVSWALSVSR